MLSHCLSQCWNIVNWTLKNTLQWNCDRNSYIFVQENAFEKIVCKIAAILYRSQCVNTLTPNKRNTFFIPWTAILHGQSNRCLSVWGMLCRRHVYWFIVNTVVWSRLCEVIKCTEFSNGHAFYAIMRLLIQHDEYIILCSAAKVNNSCSYISSSLGGYSCRMLWCCAILFSLSISAQA